MQLRSIKSYVLRQGRITDAQSRALEDLWPVYGIDYNSEPLDLDRIYCRNAPRILDIGSGMGDSVIAMAVKHRENDYLAVDVHRPGVGNLINTAKKNGLTNIRVICHDVIDILMHQIPHRSLDEVYIFFPDPWPKKRHHKRRLLSQAFLDLLAPKLKSNARLFLATDWEDLGKHMLAVCDSHPNLYNLAGKRNYSPRPTWRPVTKFENRGQKLEHSVWDLCYSLRVGGVTTNFQK